MAHRLKTEIAGEGPVLDQFEALALHGVETRCAVEQHQLGMHAQQHTIGLRNPFARMSRPSACDSAAVIGGMAAQAA
jgi:hypothetical protein